MWGQRGRAGLRSAPAHRSRALGADAALIAGFLEPRPRAQCHGDVRLAHRVPRPETSVWRPPPRDQDGACWQECEPSWGPQPRGGGRPLSSLALALFWGGLRL